MLKLGVLGDPIAHSRSPALHRAALSALEIEGSYEAIQVPRGALPAALTRLRQAGFRGVNLTQPHKIEGARWVSAQDPQALDAGAAEVGAINTIVFAADPHSQDVGYNTDVEGLVRALAEDALTLTDARVVVLGAGGAARAACAAARRAGCRSLCVVARQKIHEFTARWGAQPATYARESLLACFQEADVLLQMTSATMDPAGADHFVSSLPLAALSPHAYVLDAVYQVGPPAAHHATTLSGTALTRAAEARGLRARDGRAMLLHQGAIALERWLGRALPVHALRAMKQAVDEGLHV